MSASTIFPMFALNSPAARPAVASFVPSITTATCGLYFFRISASEAIPDLPPARYSSLLIPLQAVSERPPGRSTRHR